MAMNLEHIVSLNDRDFRAGLAGMESRTSQAMGRIGNIISQRTEGFRRLGSAITRTIGSAVGIAGTFALVGAATYGAATAIDRLINRVELLNDKLRESNVGLRDSAMARYEELQTRHDIAFGVDDEGVIRARRSIALERRAIQEERNAAETQQAEIEARLRALRAPETRTTTVYDTEAKRLMTYKSLEDPDAAERIALTKRLAEITSTILTLGLSRNLLDQIGPMEEARARRRADAPDRAEQEFRSATGGFVGPGGILGAMLGSTNMDRELRMQREAAEQRKKQASLLTKIADTAVAQLGVLKSLSGATGGSVFA